MLRLIKAAIAPKNPLRLLWHRGKAFAAALRYGFPARRLTIIGITGTDGKTTTVAMTAHILQQSGLKVGAVSTAFLQCNEKKEWNASQKTSLSPFALQGFLRQLVDDGCTHAVIEYSSHGLVQGRGNWTWPRVAAITNTSREHLDYHRTMEEYRADKARLFHMLRRSGTKVLNAEDETFSLYQNIPSAQTITYAMKRKAVEAGSDIDFWLENVEVHTKSSSASLRQKAHTPSSVVETHYPLQLMIPGIFNVTNALCAISCSAALGIPTETATAALASFSGVPGRMERLDEGQPFSVFVDFTVTPASYEATLSTLRTMLEPSKRLLVLTGSCGDRMREKRPMIGKICSSYADIVVVSNEDPYTEDPERIVDEVWAGIDQSRTKAHRILDRREAIQFLLNEAHPGDIVILCGKGADSTMWTNEGQIPWNEREIARTMLSNLG